jgi:hypothetical protein
MSVKILVSYSVILTTSIKSELYYFEPDFLNLSFSILC